MSDVLDRFGRIAASLAERGGQVSTFSPELPWERARGRVVIAERQAHARARALYNMRPRGDNVCRLCGWFHDYPGLRVPVHEFAEWLQTQRDAEDVAARRRDTTLEEHRRLVARSPLYATPSRPPRRHGRNRPRRR